LSLRFAKWKVVKKVTSEWLTTHSLSEQHICNDLLTRKFRHKGRVTLFRDRHFPQQFVEEVPEHHDLTKVAHGS
jgi:hypothetical protein